MALLHVLHRLSSELALRLVVLHVNHGLRGAESDADEAFVRELAASLDLQILVSRTLPAPGNLEQEARRVRRDFFHKCLAECGLRRIALGHTRSDQAETVLFRFLRGSGLAGLAGMRPLGEDGFMRPLLTTTRTEVRRWVTAEAISWREDSTNLDPRFARNRLRNRILPLLSGEFNSNLEEVLARAAQLAQAEEDFWAGRTDRLYREISRRTALGSILRIEAFRALHLAEQRRLIRRAVLEVKDSLLSIDLAHIDGILGVCLSSHAHDRVIVPGIDAFRSYEQLLLTRPGALLNQPWKYRISLDNGLERELPERGSIFIGQIGFQVEDCVNVKKDQEYTEEIADLDADALMRHSGPGGLLVRNWEPGDILQRAGHKGPEKVKTLFQEQRVVLWERRSWPVLMAGPEVAWVRGFGRAAKFTPSRETGRVIRLIYRRGPD
ncbi:MAG: tRNA lysidine(34) synthetase TilS [Acidobacteriaceae bacterium]|nr:tRNA lysidine(34) synthetase TilS [Acidobacteriaceae bacterium]